jgi:hypothetical protein
MTQNVVLKKSMSTSGQSGDASDDSWKQASSIYEFKATDIDGKAVDMSKYK